MNPKSLYKARQLSRHANVAKAIVESQWKDTRCRQYFIDKPCKYFYDIPHMNNEFVQLVENLRINHQINSDLEIEISEKLRSIIIKKIQGLTDPNEILNTTLDIINMSRAYLDDCNNTHRTTYRTMNNIIDGEYSSIQSIEMTQQIIDEAPENSVAYNFKTNKYIIDGDDIDYSVCILLKDMLKSIINMRDHQDFIDLIK